MADVEASTPSSLAQDYLLENKLKPEMDAKPAVEPAAEEIVENLVESPEIVDAAPAAVEIDDKASDSAAVDNKDSSPDEATDNSKPPPSNESNDSSESDSTNEEAESTPEIKLETAPADFRFPTTNQTRHCFTRYIEYHRCVVAKGVVAKGEGAPECDKFAKYYRSLCPSEWIERWNEQRENGTFPGPL